MKMQNCIVNCTNDITASPETLKINIGNAPNHAFGNHRHCTELICNVTGSTTQDKSSLMHSCGLIHHLNGKSIVICINKTFNIMLGHWVVKLSRILEKYYNGSLLALTHYR